MNIDFKVCEKNDLEIFKKISYETFDETFREENTDENMEAYLSTAYKDEKLLREIEEENSKIYLCYLDEKLFGYLKLNIDSAQSENMSKEYLEVERIYIKREFQRMGLGDVLLEKAYSDAKFLGKEKIWLGVWEHNEKAKSFYKKSGFKKIGSHSFFMGDDEQTDFLMEKII